MRASLVIPVARVLTWGCVILLAVLSLWPGRGVGFLYVLPEFNSMRTGLPGRLEHFIAYAGSAAVAIAGYGASWGGVRVIGSFWVYATVLGAWRSCRTRSRVQSGVGIFPNPALLLLFAPAPRPGGGRR